MLSGKTIAILAEEGFEDSELVEPMGAMKNADARVVIVGSGNKENYRGKRSRAAVTVDTTADKVNAKDFDGIIVPGGGRPMGSFSPEYQRKKTLNIKIYEN